MIPLGILAASGAVIVGDFVRLDQQILTSNQAAVTFSNLGQYAGTYRHLQIRMTGRSTRNDTDSIYDVWFNGDTTASNYRTHQIRGNGSTVTSSDFGNTARFYAGLVGSTISPSQVYGANVIDILDAFSTTKNKTSRALGGSTGYNYIALASHLWMNTAAINTITLDDLVGNFVEGSRFSLYGVK